MKGKKGNAKDKKSDLPEINEKYINPFKLDETEGRIQEQLSSLNSLKNVSLNYYNELVKKENELMISTKSYDKILEEKNKKILSLEEEVNQIRIEKNQNIHNHSEDMKNKINELKNTYEGKIRELTAKLEESKEKLARKKEKKIKQREELELVKKERNDTNGLLYQTISKYDKQIEEIQQKYEKEINELKKREEEYLHSNANLLESDIFTVYKEIQEKFEHKLKENVNLKGQNDRISDEVKTARLNLQNTESLLKDCAGIQVKQQKLINQYKENLEEANMKLEKKKDEYKQEFNEFNFKMQKILSEKDDEIRSLKNQIKLKSDENTNLRILSQMILDQRSETEQFFIESLEEVKQEIYKRKKENQKRSHLFPNLEKKYEEKIPLNKKVDIKDLLPEDKEKVLRYLFSKINENFKPKNYKDVNVNYTLQ